MSIKHEGCARCSFRGRKDLVTLDINGMSDEIYYKVRKAAALMGMTYQQFMRHAIADMIDRIEAGDVGAYTLVANPTQETVDER